MEPCSQNNRCGQCQYPCQKQAAYRIPLPAQAIGRHGAGRRRRCATRLLWNHFELFARLDADRHEGMAVVRAESFRLG